MESRRPLGSVLLDGPGENRIVEKRSWQEYRNTVGMNPSTIRHGRQSMLHLKYAWDHGRADTDAMLWGRAAHCLLFEPRQFENRFRPFEGTRRGDKWEEFQAECFADQAEPITQKAFDEVQDASIRLVADPQVQKLIAAGQSEVTLLATEGPIQCRGRVDWISSSEPVLVDLKTARDIRPHQFSASFYQLDYDLKLGLYQRWLERLTDQRWPVQVIALESKPPYDVAIYPIADAVLWNGAEDGLRILKRLASCMESNVWPGVANGELCDLVTPAWRMEDEEIEGAEEVEG